MSGIYISGMEMPENGHIAVIEINCLGGVRINGKPIKNKAIPVPPHGDLIERREVCLTDFEIAMCGGDYKDGMKMLLEKVEAAPTIIPAEEGET